jgi:hypothetical protein
MVTSSYEYPSPREGRKTIHNLPTRWMDNAKGLRCLVRLYLLFSLLSVKSDYWSLITYEEKTKTKNWSYTFKTWQIFWVTPAFRYFDDVLSINNHNFHNYVHLIYPDELEIKDTKESDKSASYLDILLNIDSNGRLTTSLYDKRDYFDLQSSTILFYAVTYHFHLPMVCISPSWFDTQEHVLRMRTFQNEANYLQKSWCCKVIMNLV